MNKLKFYIWNACWSSLIGLAIFFVGLVIGIWVNSFEKVWLYLVQHPFSLLLAIFSNILFCMGVGAVIGTVSLFFVFQIFSRLTQRPLIGFISNFLVVGSLNILGAIVTGFHSYQQFKNSLWFWALLVSELLSIFLLRIWYQRLRFYKEKLAQKKASLQSREDSHS